MPAPVMPHDELERASAARRTSLLGTPAEERFDKITRLARRMFGVPMAMINLVGSEALWLKSIQGFDGLEICRAVSYCAHAVVSDDVCLIEDARIDPRVSDSPFASSFVFYAGAPVKFEGHRVAALCIADTKPGSLGAEDLGRPA